MRQGTTTTVHEQGSNCDLRWRLGLQCNWPCSAGRRVRLTFLLTFTSGKACKSCWHMSPWPGSKIFQQSRASRAENSSAGLDVDVMVFMSTLVGFCHWHSRCLENNVIVFSALLGSAEDEHHFVFDCPAYCAIRNKFTNTFWGPAAPTLSSFFTLHDPKVIARFLRECFEHRNTLVARQTGHSL